MIINWSPSNNFGNAVGEQIVHGMVIADFPLFVSATVDPDGNSLSMLVDQAVKDGGAGLNGFTVTATGGAVTLTYASGAPGTPLTYATSRTIAIDEVLTNFSYTQPGNGVEAVDDDAEMASFSGQSVSNGPSTPVIRKSSFGKHRIIV